MGVDEMSVMSLTPTDGVADRVCTLDRLTPGERGTILQVGGRPTTARRLMELGFVPGTRVEVVRYAPFGDPVELRIRRVHVSVRSTETRHIHVARD
jgi:ferrous iron transport protein A